MHTVPSLVGTGTAVAAAAGGLVFGQPPEPPSTPSRPPSRKRRSTIGRDSPLYPSFLRTPQSSRPRTSWISSRDDKPHPNLPPHVSSPGAPPSPRQRPTTAHVGSTQKGHFRRHSANRLGDFPTHPVADSARDSTSTNGSWIRRLSLRPLSQAGSIRSSTGPESPSLFSHGSSAPILPNDGSAHRLPPNKLVKRPPSSSHAHHKDHPLTRPRAKTHLPSLRRPATSHQRSATLQSQPGASPLASPLCYSPRYSSEREPPRPFEPLESIQQERDQPRGNAPTGWTSFFHARSIRHSVRGIAARATEGAGGLVKRITPGDGTEKAVYLTQPRTLDPAAPLREAKLVEESPVSDGSTPGATSANPGSAIPQTPQRLTERPVQMTFTTPNWIPRPDSLRRPKRGSETVKEAKRHVSAPNPVSEVTQDNDAPEVMPPLNGTLRDGAYNGTQRVGHSQLMRRRNLSSPLPPISRLSTFNIDLSKIPAANAPRTMAPLPVIRPHQPSGSSQGSSSMAPPSLSRTRRSLTLNSSDFDHRDFTSADDDTDFRSETIFDSVRTAASAQVRSADTPLDSMFDESPPSTGGHTKGKRLSIQGIMIRNWDGDHDRIMEEDDETALTPRRLPHGVGALQEPAAIHRDERYARSSVNGHYSFADRAIGRPSIDNDEDEDWARDYGDELGVDMDHVLSSQLSPPSQGGSANMRKIDPSIRVALASISGNSLAEGRTSINTERPLSNLFDWSEPPTHDNTPRPMTAHGKHAMDMRGGRTATRKGPTAAHVRSQSVPVLNDPSETSKQPAPKFGTWGLGSNRVSEDWGDDFEFEEEEALPAMEASGKDSCRSFVVPEPIQASQSSVRAHSGQIRELSLLVNDLKRLCRHGREMDMLSGPHASLWKEAEGIIALASPDEDDMMDTVAAPGLEIPADASDRFLNDAFDAKSLAKSEDAIDFTDINISKTTVVRERPSPRRRSVFSPDDDIFGAGAWPLSDDAPPEHPRTPESRVVGGGEDVTGIVRTVMDAMQQPRPQQPRAPAAGSKVHFDTTSLKALVKRASDLRDLLSDVVRRGEAIAPSPARAGRDGSPAFTRVFNEPPGSPSRRLPHSRSKNSVLSRASSMETSSGALGNRLQVMTVN